MTARTSQTSRRPGPQDVPGGPDRPPSALTVALAALAPVDLDARGERAAKALERERCKQFEWSDKELDIWWDRDERCERAERIAEARFIVLAAAPESSNGRPLFAGFVKRPTP